MVLCLLYSIKYKSTKQKLYVYTDCLKAQHCEGFIKIRNIGPLGLLKVRNTFVRSYFLAAAFKAFGCQYPLALANYVPNGGLLRPDDGEL